jgi:hypothetical protein
VTCLADYLGDDTPCCKLVSSKELLLILVSVLVSSDHIGYFEYVVCSSLFFSEP